MKADNVLFYAASITPASLFYFTYFRGIFFINELVKMFGWETKAGRVCF